MTLETEIKEVGHGDVLKPTSATLCTEIKKYPDGYRFQVDLSFPIGLETIKDSFQSESYPTQELARSAVDNFLKRVEEDEDLVLTRGFLALGFLKTLCLL